MDFDNGIRRAKDQGDDQGKRVDFGLFADELHVCMCVRVYLIISIYGSNVQRTFSLSATLYYHKDVLLCDEPWEKTQPSACIIHVYKLI